MKKLHILINPETIEKIVGKASVLSKDINRRGGFLSIWNNFPLSSLTAVAVGKMTTEKAAKYCQLSTKKVTSVVRYKLRRTFERLNEASEDYGGGILFADNIAIAFSGYSPEMDEAISVCVGSSVNNRSAKDAINLAKKWQARFAPDNHLITQLAEAVWGEQKTR